jgi:CDP-diglyceride synthetase
MGGAWVVHHFEKLLTFLLIIARLYAKIISFRRRIMSLALASCIALLVAALNLTTESAILRHAQKRLANTWC